MILDSEITSDKHVAINIIQKFLITKGEGNNVAKMINDSNKRRRDGDKNESGAGDSGHSSTFESFQDSQTEHQGK